MGSKWYERPITRRAPAGGSLGIDGREYRGGEFEPFYTLRPQMPQIDFVDYPELIGWLHAQGILTTQGVIRPEDLKIHQKMDRFDPRLMKPKDLSKPVLISLDNFILDGDHREVAHLKNHTTVPFVRIELEWERAIEMLFQFPKTTKANYEGNINNNATNHSHGATNRSNLRD